MRREASRGSDPELDEEAVQEADEVAKQLTNHSNFTVMASRRSQVSSQWNSWLESL